MQEKIKLDNKGIDEVLSQIPIMTFFDTAPIGIAITDFTGRAIKTNHSLRKMTGYSETEYLNKDFTKFIQSENIHEDIKVFRLMLNGNLNKYETEKRFMKKNGEKFWVHVTAFVVKDSNGKPQFIIGMFEDIQKRKTIEKKLNENQQRMRLALEGTGGGTWDWDVNTGDILFDENWPIVLGYKPDETKFDFDWWSKSVHPESKPVFEKALSDYLNGRTKYYELEYRMKAKSGEWKWIKARGVCVSFDKLGNPRRFIGTHRDVTQQKRMEEENYEKNKDLEVLEELKKIYNILPLGIVYLDSDFRFISVNKFTTDIIGVSEEELIGKICYETVGEYKDDSEKIGREKICSFCKKEECFDKGEPTVIERPLGDRIIRVSTIPEIDSQGNVNRFLEIAEDITEQKNAKDELQKAHDSLELRVKERTAQFMEANRDLENEIHHRKKIENEVRNQNNFLNTIIESIPYPFYVIDSKSHLIKLANSAVSKFGDWKNSTCHKISHHNDTPCNSDEHICPLEMMKISKKPEVVEHIHYDLEGNERYYEVHGYPIFDEKDELVQMIEFSLDVTDRKLAEMVTSHLASITENSHDAIASLDLFGTFTSWNQGAEEIFGYKKEEVIGKSFGFFVPEELKHGCFKLLETVSENGFMRGIESERVAKDGTHVNVEMTISTLEDFQGKQIGFTFILRDITKRLKAEKELQDLKEFNENIIESSGMGTMVLNRNFNLIAINESQEELFGKPRSELLGKNIFQFTGLKGEIHQGAGFEEILSNVLLGEIYRIRSHQHKALSGGNIYLDFDITPLRIGGIIQGIVFLSEDVTEREATGRKLVQYAHDLKESNEMKDLFTDIMRHDLLNPIGIIGTTAEMVLEDNPDDEDIDLIYKNYQKAAELIDSATTLSKLEKASEFERQNLDLEEIIQEISADLYPMFQKAEINLLNKIDFPMPFKGNKIISHTLVNLLTNSIKYAPNGKQVIIEGKDSGEHWIVKVTDHGPGIKDEDKIGIFERFKRRNKKGVKGSGLGLAIAKKIVEIHKGKIYIEDNPEGGAVFVVELPKE